MPDQLPYVTDPVEWYAPGAAIIIEKDLVQTLIRFKDGKLVGGILRDNHSLPIGDMIALHGLQEQAILRQFEYDLYTPAEVGEAEAAGFTIPEKDQTSRMWQIFFAKDSNHKAYAFILNTKYFSKADAIAFAKSVKFSKDAFN